MSLSHKALAAALILASITSANTGYIERRALWNENAGGPDGWGMNPGGGAFTGQGFGSGGDSGGYNFPGVPSDVPKVAPTAGVPAEIPPAVATNLPKPPASGGSGAGAGSAGGSSGGGAASPSSGSSGSSGSGAGAGAGTPSTPSMVPIPKIPEGGSGSGSGSGSIGSGSGGGTGAGAGGAASTALPSMVPIPTIPGSTGAGGENGQGGAGTGQGGGQGGEAPPQDPNQGIGENGIVPTVASGIGPNGVAEGLVLGGYYGEYNPLSFFNGRANTLGNANYVIYPPYNIFPYNPFINYGKAARVRLAHASLSAATFVFILPVGGIFVRILPGPIGTAVHALTQLTGYILFVAAVGMGIWMTLYVQSPDFNMVSSLRVYSRIKQLIQICSSDGIILSSDSSSSDSSHFNL
jgi:hypothetical protein